MDKIKTISQALLIEIILPEIKKTHQEYFKFQQVLARQAIIGERVETITSSGHETTNVAKADDQYVIKNLTSTNEQYIISKDKFLQKYTWINDVDSLWSIYRPLGKVFAIKITLDLAARLGAQTQFKIVAPWGTQQLVNVDDMFVSPLPDLNHVYRTDLKEFVETYKKTS